MGPPFPSGKPRSMPTGAKDPLAEAPVGRLFAIVPLSGSVMLALRAGPNRNRAFISQHLKLPQPRSVTPMLMPKLRILAAATVTFAIGATGLSPVGAEDGFQLDTLEPLPAQGRAILDLGTSHFLDHGQLSIGFFSAWQHSPLTAVVDGERDRVLARLVEHRVTVEALVAIGLFRRIEFGVAMPGIPLQTGATFDVLGEPDRQVQGSSLGDLRLSLRGRVFGPAPGQNGLGLHLAFPIALPTGDTNAFTSDGFVRARPSAGLDYRHDILRFGGNVGWEFRPKRFFNGYVANDLLHWGAWVSLEAVPRHLDVSVVARGHMTSSTRAASGTTSTGRTATAEVLALLDFRVADWLVQLGGGAALARGVGTPDGRAIFGVGWAPSPDPDSDGDFIPDDQDECHLRPEDRDGFEDEDGCPDPDNDGDGVPDEDDRCPNEAETLNGYQDEDGCPERDRDGDGIVDVMDKCPDEPEDVDGFLDDDGCPDLDNDGDGVDDDRDRCPAEREDLDGFEDEDGCPDLDNDADGIPDVRDKCPDVPENFNNLDDHDGCPEPDQDGDGIPDQEDLCPALPESDNGWRDDDGCPDARNPFIASFALEIRTSGPIYFSYDNERVKPDHIPTLKALASLLKVNPWITRLRIEGHTDSEGPEDLNLQLSAQRARVVKDFLISAGVAERRLVSAGLGEQFPIADNSTPMGRIRNRRIEFHIAEINGIPVPATPAPKAGDTPPAKAEDAP